MTNQRQYLQHKQSASTRMGPDEETPLHIALATEAVLDGWTRVQVATARTNRIQRDQGYPADRKTRWRKTNYDDQVQQEMRVLALAALWLEASVADERRISDARR